jgi:prolyl-tRNA synthetase
MKWTDLASAIPVLLETIHEDMYQRALKTRDEHLKSQDTWEGFMEEINKKNLVLTPWCNEQECEKAAKDKSKEESSSAMEKEGETEELLTGAAKTLCIPFD